MLNHRRGAPERLEPAGKPLFLHRRHEDTKDGTARLVAMGRRGRKRRGQPASLNRMARAGSISVWALPISNIHFQHDLVGRWWSKNTPPSLLLKLAARAARGSSAEI